MSKAQKTMMVVVSTYRMSDMTLNDERVIDYNDHSKRQWLGKHCRWAFHNGYGVQTRPEQHPPHIAK